MDALISSIIELIGQYGWVLSGIAILGIVILGILKYAGAFKKYEENVRHFLYLLISVGFSCVVAIVYLLIIGSFDLSAFLVFVTAVFALNQAAYALYANTGLKALIKELLEKAIELLEKYKSSK